MTSRITARLGLFCIRIATLVLCVASVPAVAKDSLLGSIERAVANRTVAVPAGEQIEYGFSPGEGAEELVLKIIGVATREIRILGYTFTSAPIVNALVAAKQRGVDVALVVDYRNNLIEEESGKARAALSTLVSAGVPVRTIAKFPRLHDKVVVTDGQHVEIGSFNFTAGATRNSESVVVVWNNSGLAKAYLRHWQTRFDQGQDFRLRY